MNHKLVFHKIRDAECDFCGVKRRVVTSVNENTYVCHKCAAEINKHARGNWRVTRPAKAGLREEACDD